MASALFVHLGANDIQFPAAASRGTAPSIQFRLRVPNWGVLTLTNGFKGQRFLRTQIPRILPGSAFALRIGPWFAIPKKATQPAAQRKKPNTSMLMCAGRVARKRALAATSQYDVDERNRVHASVARPQVRIGPRVVRSKNCANAKKAKRTARRWEAERQEINDKRRKVEQLERQLALATVARATAYQNAQTSALKLVETYHHVLRRGVHPTQRGDAKALEIQRFIHSAISEGIRTVEFSGLETFIQQWDFMSSYHTDMDFHADRVEFFSMQGEAHMYPALATHPPDEPVFVIQSTGNTTLRISRATIEHIFPHALRDEPLVQWLIGKTYSFAFTMYSHVSTSGHIFQMESRVDLMSSLMNLLRDPVAALNLSSSAAMCSSGSLLVQDEVREAQYTLANCVL